MNNYAEIMRQQPLYLQELKKREAQIETRMDSLMKEKSSIYTNLDECAKELDSIRNEIRDVEFSRAVIVPAPVVMTIE